MYEANNKLLENYSFRRFESGGIRKTANFVPCVLATKLTVKMAKTLDIQGFSYFVPFQAIILAPPAGLEPATS